MHIKSIFFRFNLLLLFVFFVSSWSVLSQGNQVSISWDSQVACRDYGSQGNPQLNPREQERMFFNENTSFGPCLRFCSGDPTTFTITGTNIFQVDWHVIGAGKVVNVSTNPTQSVAQVVWNPNGSAQVYFVVTFINGEKKQGKLCVELVPSPKASFKLLEQTSSVLLACLDTPLPFINTSSTEGGPGIVAYEWDFGNGDYSYTESPVYTYKTPGRFTIVLKITNECGCSSTFTKQIDVKPSVGIKITCPGVVCELTTITYSVTNSCGGSWKVDGGTILSQTATSVQVKWDQVNKEEGFGYVHYTSNCGCGAPTTVKVPVILNNPSGVSNPELRVAVKGNTTICVGSHARYSLPQWPSTAMVWSLTPVSGSSPSGASLVYTDQRNEVIVKGSQPGVYILEADYYNTLLDCGGKSKPIYITVLNPPVVSGPQAICSGTSSTYTTTAGTSMRWKLYKDGTLITSTTATSFNYSFPVAGTYSVVAGGTGSGLCEAEPYQVIVAAKPENPTSLEGAKMVCPGKPYTYTLGSTDDASTIEWQVTGGIILGSAVGDSVTVTFNATGPYALKVRRIAKDAAGCVSDWVTFTLAPMNPAATIVNTDNLISYCPSSYTNFKVNMATGFEAQQIEWEFVPSNFGNIISGQGTEAVQVSLNEIAAGNITGSLVVKLTNCNQSWTYTQSITLFQLPAITFPAGAISVCSGESFTLQFNSSVPIRSAQVTWEWDSGQTYSQTVTSATGVTTVTSPSMMLSNLGNGVTTKNVVVKITNINSCKGTTEATRNIVVNPKPSIQITPPGPFKVCQATGAGFPVILVANFVSGTTTTNVTWYRKGSSVPVQTSGMTLTINANDPNRPIDAYYAVAKMTSPNTCTATSNEVELKEDCANSDICGQMTVNKPVISIDQTDCNTYTLTGSYSGSPTKVTWLKSAYLTLVSSNNTTATFTTTVPGYHPVGYTIEYTYMGQLCEVSATAMIHKPYEADFLFDMLCPTTGSNRDVKLIDNSQYLSESGVTYQYYRNNVAIAGATTKNYTDTNVAPGTYTYMLKIEKSGEKPCYKTKTIVVKGKPNALFTMIYDPKCVETPVKLIQAENEPGYTYKWDFSGTSFIGANPTINLKPNIGLQSIKLTVTDPYNCTAIYEIINIQVNQADFGLVKLDILSGSKEFCQGGSAVLRINTSLAPATRQWMRGTAPIPGATASTYTVTQTGDYWAMLYDADGCSFSTALHAVGIAVKSPPTVSLLAPATVCYADSVQLEAVVSDPGVQRQWSRDGVVIYPWSATTPLTLTQNMAAGTYTYTIEVRNGAAGCSSKAAAIVKVSTKPTNPTISKMPISCMPYRVRLTATSTAGSGGTFNWSNGQTGPWIEVSDGGAYAVVYTDANGCSSSSSVVVPKMPEAYLWEVPTGCVTICSYSTPYLLGPWLAVDSYRWLYNNNPVKTGNGSIPSQDVFGPGEYRLNFNINSCLSLTDPLYVNFGGGACSNRPSGAMLSSVARTTPTTKEEIWPNTIVLYPNPAVNQAMLSYDIQTDAAVEVHVQLYTILGVKLWSSQNTNTQGSFSIPVTTLPVGQYLVVVTVNGQRYYENTLIKK